MDIDKFEDDLKELSQEITDQVRLLETSPQKGFYEMQGLLEKLQELLPQWFFFIEQTEIGTKEQILAMFSDMETAMEAEDSILLGDVLLCGLRTAVEEYIEIIDEAMNEE